MSEGSTTVPVAQPCQVCSGPPRRLRAASSGVCWLNRIDLRNLCPATLYAFHHSPNQKGIGEPLAQGDVLIANTRNAQMVDELRALVRNDDVRIEKVRMNGFIGTPLDQGLRTQGIGTLN